MDFDESTLWSNIFPTSLLCLTAAASSAMICLAFSFPQVCIHTHLSFFLLLSIYLLLCCVHLRTAYTIKIKLNFVSMSLLCIFYLHRIASLHRTRSTKCAMWLAKLRGQNGKKAPHQNTVGLHTHTYIHFVSLVLVIITAHSSMKWASSLSPTSIRFKIHLFIVLRAIHELGLVKLWMKKNTGHKLK